MKEPTRKVLQEMQSGGCPSLESATEEKQETRSFSEGGQREETEIQGKPTAGTWEEAGGSEGPVLPGAQGRL